MQILNFSLSFFLCTNSMETVVYEYTKFMFSDTSCIYALHELFTVCTFCIYT